MEFIPSAISLFRREKKVFVCREEADRRLAICRGCERFSSGMCAECGCVMTAKVRFHAAKCPLKGKERKW
jgi:hypothetical protein